MYFKEEEILKIIEIYSKASGQKFVVDPGVRGKVSIFNGINFRVSNPPEKRQDLQLVEWLRR